MAGCYSPPEPACGFFCGPSGACPADYTCFSDQRCHLNSAPVTPCDGDGGIPTRDAVFVDTPGFEGIVLLDADVTAPTVEISPTNGATGVPTDQGVFVAATFSEPVINVNPTTFTLTQGGNLVTTNFDQVDSAHDDLFPTFPLMPSTTYTVSLTSAIQDFNGNPLAPVSTTFTTL